MRTHSQSGTHTHTRIRAIESVCCYRCHWMWCVCVYVCLCLCVDTNTFFCAIVGQSHRCGTQQQQPRQQWRQQQTHECRSFMTGCVVVSLSAFDSICLDILYTNALLHTHARIRSLVKKGTIRRAEQKTNRILGSSESERDQKHKTRTS